VSDDNQQTLNDEAGYRALMDQASDGIPLSRRGVIVGVNQALLERSGYTRQELLGHEVADFVAEEFRDLVHQDQSAPTAVRFDAVALHKAAANCRLRWSPGSMRLTAGRCASRRCAR
jgi:PAS domain-containing protein